MDIGYPLILISGIAIGWGFTRFYWERRELRTEKASQDQGQRAFERSAQIAEAWRCEVTGPYDAPQNIRERVERQNKVACEIAAAIRAEIGGGR